jgi:hypothetical protein
VRFMPGHDTVGGETDMAVVTKHEGFKWVQRKHYYPLELNQVEETYGKTATRTISATGTDRGSRTKHRK